MIASSTRRPDCRLCHGTRLELVVALTPTPPANALVPPAEAGTPTASFPLDVFLCRDCGHVQLLEVVAAEDLFCDYRYLTGTSPSLVAYTDRYADEVLAATHVGPGARILEFGSNDGTQLAAFARRGLRPLGVDPAGRPAAIANDRGIPTLLGFFGPQLRDQLVDRGPFDLVVANNVLAHIDDLDSVVDLVAEVLAPDGTFVFDVGYLGDVIAHTLFDVIYHEHLDYHGLEPLLPFFERHGLSVVDVERSPMQGGSIRVYVRYPGAAASTTVRDLVAEERVRGLNDPAVFARFSTRIGRLRAGLRDVVLPLVASGAPIWGYGAAAKATTLLYHFGMGEIIERVVDDNPAKQGLLTPGHHIPVVHPRELYTVKPDHVLVFAWNYLDYLCQEHRAYLDGGGELIVPLPELSIIRNNRRTGGSRAGTTGNTAGPA
jgi:SAM-dependent methyltransferase